MQLSNRSRRSPAFLQEYKSRGGTRNLYVFSVRTERCHLLLVHGDPCVVLSWITGAPSLRAIVPDFLERLPPLQLRRRYVFETERPRDTS